MALFNFKSNKAIVKFWLECKKQAKREKTRKYDRHTRRRYLGFPDFGRPWLIDSKQYPMDMKSQLSYNLGHVT